MKPYTILSLVFLAIFLITGCGSSLLPIQATQQNAAPSQTSVPTETGPTPLTIATGETESSWYEIGRQISQQMNAKIPDTVATVKTTDNVMENLKLLTSGKAQLTLGYEYHVTLANQGNLMTAFHNAPDEKLTIKCGVEIVRPAFPDYSQPVRIILPLYEEYLHIITTDASGITTLADLRGRHISTSEPGSPSEQQARFLLTGLGMDWEDDVIRETLDLSQAISALREGEIDALITSSPLSTPEIKELFSRTGIRAVLIPIQGEDAETIQKANPGIFHQAKIPAGVYTSVEMETLATTIALLAMEDLPAGLVHRIASVIADEDTGFQSFLTEDAQKYLHAGSLKYFAEQGILK